MGPDKILVKLISLHDTIVARYYSWCFLMTTSDRIRILVVSKCRLSAIGLRQVVQQAPNFEVVAEADSPERAVELHRTYLPAIVLLEIGACGPSEVLIWANLTKALQNASIIVVASNENIRCVRHLLAAGVLGYVLSTASDSELFLAIRSAYEGRHFIDPRLSDSLTDVLLGTATATTATTQGQLSKREMQVLRALALGFTSREVGEQLQLSTKTVETYRARIYTKLELKTRAALVDYAIASGLLREPGQPARFAAAAWPGQ
jgi:two-component system response regulator NreC